MTPSIEFGKASSSVNADLPKKIANKILPIPKNTTEAPCRAPNLCCPARPPAPWLL